MWLPLAEIIGKNIAGQSAGEGIFGVDASQLTVPQAAFLAGLPQSPITYSPYENTGEVKSDEDLEIGLRRAKAVLYSMYRTGALSKDKYSQYKVMTLNRTFFTIGHGSQEFHETIYTATLAEAQERMYYLAPESNVLR